ncbi:hypothetical protein AVEN_89275-1 [Araneus ventricosus]|uniref:Uncharacterized protein n=1 Tax=Araneus ventricosus TaxID=182803 RepID=A0A4Y2LIT6_ARAVE|nr:hypothetical protein AVEN_89275-1 [Araneus ventricosus]
MAPLRLAPAGSIVPLLLCHGNIATLRLAPARSIVPLPLCCYAMAPWAPLRLAPAGSIVLCPSAAMPLEMVVPLYSERVESVILL